MGNFKHTIRYDWKRIGQRIKKERDAAKLSQSQLMDKIGRSPESYRVLSRWEKGTAKPEFRDMVELCNVFDCELGYLLCEYECKTRETTDIQEATGLLETAIEKLNQMSINDKYNWQISTLNSLILCEKFRYFVAVITDYATIDEKDAIDGSRFLDGGCVNIPNDIKRLDVLTVLVQNTLKEMLDELRVLYRQEDMKLKWWYKNYYSICEQFLKDGKMDRVKHDKLMELLDSGEYAEFERLL